MVASEADEITYKSSLITIDKPTVLPKNSLFMEL